jgi:hypothetical protein
MRDTERRIGSLEREVGSRDARLEEAAAAKASIGIEVRLVCRIANTAGYLSFGPI